MTSKFTNKVTVEKSISEVFDFMYDVKNHKHLHPLITHVHLSETYTNNLNQKVCVYVITDKVPVAGMFSFKQVYTSIQTLIEVNRHYTFTVPPTSGVEVFVDVLFDIISENKTQIQMQAHIKAPALFHKFVVKKADSSHKKMLRLLPAALAKNL